MGDEEEIERLTTEFYRELAKDIGDEKVVKLFGNEAEKRLKKGARGEREVLMSIVV